MAVKVAADEGGLSKFQSLATRPPKAGFDFTPEREGFLDLRSRVNPSDGSRSQGNQEDCGRDPRNSDRLAPCLSPNPTLAAIAGS